MSFAHRDVCCSTLPLSQTDIALVFEDISLGRSIVPPHASCARPALLRWDPARPLSLENCVVAEFKEAELAVQDVFGVGAQVEESAVDGGEAAVDAHGEVLQRRARSPTGVWGEEVAGVVQKRLAEAKRFEAWALQ